MQGCATAPGMRATLVRQAERFSFAPSDGALVISGSVATDGSFIGSLVTNASRHDQTGGAGNALLSISPGQQVVPPSRTSRESSAGTAVQPFTLTVTGHLDDATATGTYVTPRCHAEFRLPRIGATLAP